MCIGRWLRAHGASPDNPATVAVGISLDEIHSTNSRRVEPYERVVYPLLELGLRRTDCVGIIRRAGLAVPPKSSCWFCPLHRPSAWADMRRDGPDLFSRACQLEDLLNARLARLGRDPVWLNQFNRPLADAIAEAQAPLLGLDLDGDGDGECDNSACFT